MTRHELAPKGLNSQFLSPEMPINFSMSLAIVVSSSVVVTLTFPNTYTVILCSLLEFQYRRVCDNRAHSERRDPELRRFRGLPIYATSMAYGQRDYKEMLIGQIHLARIVATFIHHHPALKLIPEHIARSKDVGRELIVIIFFRARDPGSNAELVWRINASAQVYVSGTLWGGKPANRIAVFQWQVDP